ncbi:MAG: hypothetical protein LBF92_02825 [Synergistaceae bacterium]|jgi:hypothetical protein|nr:hypothetical protein [Synergistaceae bacterium]
MRNKKLLSLVLALAFIFSAMGLAFAPSPAVAAVNYLEGSAIPPSSSRDTSTYEITSPDAAASIEVTFVIEAGNQYFEEEGKFWVSHDLTLSQASPGYFTVTDLLVAVNNNKSFDLTFYDAQGKVIDASTDYVKSVKHGDITWEGNEDFGYDGWAVRVNDLFPVLTDGTGWIGATILETKIKDGDVVHMFYDFPADFSPASGSFAANYVRGVYVDSSASSLTVQLQGHTTFIYPEDPYTMYVDNYKNVQAGVTAYLYDPTGTRLLNSEVSDLNGRVTFSGTFSSGTYIVTTDSVYFPAYDPAEIADDTYFALTGAYSKVSIR